MEGLLSCPSDLPRIELAHPCHPLVYDVGPKARERLAEGEAVPISVRCRRCDGRVFASLVDPAARARRVAEAKPDPAALRFTGPPAKRPPLRVVGQACPACGVEPDQFGLCRCSA